MTHPETTQEFLRTFQASMAASEVRNHDLNIDDSYAIEAFLRRQNPKVTRAFVAEVIVAAQQQRNGEDMEWLFEKIERNTAESLPNDTDEIVGEIAADVRAMSRCDPAAPPSDDIGPAAAHYTAILLLRMAAWRALKTMRDAYDEDEARQAT